ncbi:hypothetical protein L873DRAFT_1805080 [Choiromyces venosus 120613-1]|uniref:Uncharacterized protein n=1 Tax=Choiromyces venosus 120613-1 TaxID=1336337 RepID=A0A3N4JQK2_9PEZI|nr:hypothetical protein L873DRAFT_1805080 [Choiromyces venosus 120613-1]
MLENLSDFHRGPPSSPTPKRKQQVGSRSSPPPPKQRQKGFTLGSRGDNGHPPGWRICGSG